VATGLSVANVYYIQPLLDDVRQDLHAGAGITGLIVTASQIGYVAGLLLLVPLGDLLERRRLLAGLMALAGVGQAVVASSASIWVLFVAVVAVGVLSVTAQMIVAHSASVAGEEERGRVVGTVMSGLLLGILLARTVAGYLAELGGWRTVFWIAAAVMVLLAVAIYFAVEPYEQEIGVGYGALLRSLGTLVKEEPVLRRRMLLGAAGFGAFNVFWTPLAFLLSGSPFHYSAGTVGLFGLAGLAGAGAASVAGRLADAGRARLATWVTAVLVLAAWAAIVPGGTGNALAATAFLVIGALVLDFAVQGLHITNQSQIYTLHPAARSRLTSAYMTGNFSGGVVGSALASLCWSRWGWAGCCVLGVGFGLLAVLGAILDRRPKG
jgi:predicted MFS family arabinose efflux permease